MPATVLVRSPPEQAQATSSKFAVRIVSVASRIDSISLTKAQRASKGVREFEFDADLSESSRTEDSLDVKYALKFWQPTTGQVCTVSGEAVLRFSQFNPEADFHTLGNDITNEMAVEIFRSNYQSLYLLHDALEMDAPSPWITQDVSLSSRSQETCGPNDS